MGSSFSSSFVEFFCLFISCYDQTKLQSVSFDLVALEFRFCSCQLHLQPSRSFCAVAVIIYSWLQLWEVVHAACVHVCAPVFCAWKTAAAVRLRAAEHLLGAAMTLVCVCRHIVRLTTRSCVQQESSQVRGGGAAAEVGHALFSPAPPTLPSASADF